jgi:amino acid transporter
LAVQEGRILFRLGGWPLSNEPIKNESLSDFLPANGLNRVFSPKGDSMMRQIDDRQGRMINPLQMVLFLAALLIFIFTVVYRMIKSASFSNAMATLVEYLLILAFFILLGILLAYLFYFIYQKLLKGTHRLQSHPMFDSSSGRDKAASKSEHSCFDIESKNKVDSQ